MVRAGRRVVLIVHQERETVWIGEPVRPRLQVVNERATSVELGRGFRFDAEQLVFTGPGGVHLTGPDGQSLTAPYRRVASEATEVLRLPPREETWRDLPIDAHLQLRTPGRYAFSLELADEQGVVHASNEIPINLVNVPSPLPAGAVELQLQPAETHVRATDLRSLRFGLDAVFHNRHRTPLVLLRPQDDSTYGWTNPVYRFVITDASGRELALGLRSGSMAVPSYGPSAQVRVASGGSHREHVMLPPVPGMWRPGRYRVRLTYIVRERAIGKSGRVLDQPIRWEPEVFVGHLESNEVEVHVAE